MGNFQTKKKGTEEEIVVYDVNHIFYDDIGNLRYSSKLAKPVEQRNEELTAIMKCEEEFNAQLIALKGKHVSVTQLQPSEEEFYCIIDSVWIDAWLQYVHLNTMAPGPGPCRNDRLIVFDDEKMSWVSKKGLRPASKLLKGDYRRVSKKIWETYKLYYPASGPMITVGSDYLNDKTWVIHDHAPPKLKENKTLKLIANNFK